MPFIILIVGLIFLFIGIRIEARDSKIRKSGKRTNARVTGYKESTKSVNSDNLSNTYTRRTAHYPILKFTDSEGNEVIETALYGASWKSHTTDTDVPIFYYKDGEQYYVMLQKNIGSSALPILFIIAGSLATLVGLFISVFYIVYLTSE